jgi:hypothetical protein
MPSFRAVTTTVELPASAVTAGHDESISRQLPLNEGPQHFFYLPAGLRDDFYARRRQHRFEWSGDRSTYQHVRVQLRDATGPRRHAVLAATHTTSLSSHRFLMHF